MVKQSPFQHDLFDFKYIEDQVAEINKNINNSASSSINEESEQSLNEVLNNHLSILQDIQYLLIEIENNTKKKKGWFNFKEDN